MLVFANEDVGRLIWLNGVFEASESIFLEREIRLGDICIDVGGNIGYFSLLMARCARKGHVHTFEPIPLNVAMIHLNTELSGLHNITINQLALSDEDGIVAFSISVDSAYSSMRATGTFSEAQAIAVRAVRLDQYLATQQIERIDIVKIDVEGAEEKVLRGGEALFRDPSRRPRLMMLELYDANLASYDTTVAQIVETMQNWGYAPHTVMEDGSALVPLDPAKINATYNIFFTPSC